VGCGVRGELVRAFFCGEELQKKPKKKKIGEIKEECWKRF